MLSGTPFARFGANQNDEPCIVGVDEAGRGPLAGPVVAAACVLCKPPPDGLDDSKKLSAKRREELEQTIRKSCAFGIAVIDAGEVDQLNILGATMLAMTRAVAALEAQLGRSSQMPPLTTLIDGNLTPEGRCHEWRWPARAIVGGDGLEPAIGAASILAKTWRDRMMVEAARTYPQYGWERNKGYGSKEHMAALRRYGPTPMHRRSFAPVSQMEMPL